MDAFSFLVSRGANPANVVQLDPGYANQLANALADGEAATGERAAIGDTYRNTAIQAQLRANNKGQQISWDGKVYQPAPGSVPGRTLAAPPGGSMHGRGLATDLG